jgi:hypothetical protein
MPKSESKSGPQKLSTLSVSIFSHLTPMGVRENEKISRDSQEFLKRKSVRKTNEWWLGNFALSRRTFTPVKLSMCAHQDSLKL